MAIKPEARQACPDPPDPIDDPSGPEVKRVGLAGPKYGLGGYGLKMRLARPTRSIDKNLIMY
jgi:hypothetical protein